MPENSIPKPFRHLTPEHRKTVLANWERFLVLVAVHTDRFTWLDRRTDKVCIDMRRIGAIAAAQLITELKWKAALEATDDETPLESESCR